MNKLKIITGALLVLLLASCSKDFQSSNWGDTMEEVMDTDKVSQWYQSESPDGIQSAVYLEGQIENLPAIIFYAFSNNELVTGRHVFMETHSDPAQYYTDYTVINNTLQDKLGDEDVDYVFSADIEKQTPEQWGESIYRGDLLIQTKWENKRTNVIHAIFGENHEITHSVEYNSTQQKKAHPFQNTPL